MRSPASSLLVAAFALTLAALALPAGAQAQAQPVYRLPWPAGQGVFVTQDCNDSCCSDHVGHNAYAWDFAVHGSFDVLAPRAGTIVHVKMSSNRGGDADMVDAANYLVIDHGDGTASVMLHLAYNSLDPAVRCGGFVRAGQRLAVTGSTGWSSGNHLHYQVNRIPPNVNQACECGPDGMGCGEMESHWDLFWSRNPASASVPVTFEEWREASVCGDRHDENIVVSRNVDSREEVRMVAAAEPGRFVPLRGAWWQTPGALRGGFQRASTGADASALLSFESAVARPGIYEVWSALPVESRAVGGTASARFELVGRGERASVATSQNTTGGGYRPLPRRIKLTGHRGEGLLVAASGRAGEALLVDNVMLRRVADAGRAGEGAACSASTDCAGDLVCSAGRCRAGCERTACGAGETCDPTGVCLPTAALDPRSDAMLAARALAAPSGMLALAMRDGGAVPSSLGTGAALVEPRGRTPLAGPAAESTVPRGGARRGAAPAAGRVSVSTPPRGGARGAGEAVALDDVATSSTPRGLPAALALLAPPGGAPRRWMGRALIAVAIGLGATVASRRLRRPR